MNIDLADLVLAAIFGIGVGFFSALFGVGGGVLIVPFIVLVLDSNQHLAEGTSLAAIVPIALAGLVAHARTGYVEWRAAVWVGIGGAIGATGGVLIAYQLSGEGLRKVFAIFLLLIAARTIFTIVRPAEQRVPDQP
jgi:uncharacterized protein